MHLSSKRWQDQLIIVLGLWLFISPWVLGFGVESPPARNAYIAGAVMAILAVFDLYKTYLWAVILNLVVGLWVAASPWALHVAQLPPLRNNALLVGLAVVVLAVWELLRDPELHRQWAGPDSRSGAS